MAPDLRLGPFSFHIDFIPKIGWLHRKGGKSMSKFIYLFLCIFLTLPVLACPFKLVDLSEHFTTKDGKYAHPAFIQLLKDVQNLEGVEFWRVTEAFPPVVHHISKGHFDGTCIDFTLRTPKKAQEVCDFINEQENFKCVNEYKVRFKTTTGKHLHTCYKEQMNGKIHEKRTPEHNEQPLQESEDSSN